MNRGARVEVTPPECALAAEMFDHFCSAGTMKQILALHREICNTLTLKPNRLPDFYPKLKAKLVSSWKAQALFKKFDARANNKVYGKGRVCVAGRVLIIGAGPCGLRAAIECQLLGAKVVVIEKRDRMSRNNVLHLWPFVIQDLRALGAKKFFGKFCAGSIDHISIRQLQCILLKVALLLGVEFHEGVSFEELLEPTVTENGELLGWRARVSPADHPVCQYEFDALVGADGKRNTLHGFKRKEFRGKLAMAITANFINRHTEQEASVPEISGVAFIFNQKFFKELYEMTGIDLENIVYYKDDTHYFVMTAKKHSLLDKGVLLNDYTEVSRLLSVDNVDRAALMRYAQEAARFSTDGRLPLRDFALNHYGEPDVALFDFTSMYAAENASMVYERHSRRLLCQLVGDSLLEPFWPTGSGCARGFLSALDAAWAVRAWGLTPAPHPLHVIAERESVYRLLAQTTPENLHRDFGAYTLDPGTRYPNLNRGKVTPHQVTPFYDSDEPLPLDAVPAARKRRREAEVPEETLTGWVGCTGGVRAACGSSALAAAVRRYRPDLLPPGTDSNHTVYHVLQREYGIAPVSTSTGSIRDTPETKLRAYLSRVYSAFKGEVPHVHHETDVFDQIKQSQTQQKEKRNMTDHCVSVYSNAAETDKSHSSCRKKRRSVRPQVSNDPAEYIRKKIGKLDLDDITRLATLIDGHDAVPSDDRHTDKQKELQEQILALLDPDESPDPRVLRESIVNLLQGTSKTKVKPKEMQEQTKLDKFFQTSNKDSKPVKPPRRLKGLDLSTIKVPDFSDIFDEAADTDATLVKADSPERYRNTFTTIELKKVFERASSGDCPKKDLKKSGLDMRKDFKRSYSIDGSEIKKSPGKEIPMLKGRRRSEAAVAIGHRHSPSPDTPPNCTRSNSVGANEIVNTRRIAQMFEGNKRSYSPEPRSVRSGSTTTADMAYRMKRMAEIIEGKRLSTPTSPRKKRSESIGTPEMMLRKQRVADLIEGEKVVYNREPPPQRRNSGEMASRMQRVNNMMQKVTPKHAGRRKAAREIMKQRFEKSLQMLATEPRLEFAPSADLENDYGLQQYRANAPDFGDRVRKLEKQLQHYEEGRIVGGGGSGRTAGGGARVARLAAELAGTTTSSAPKSSKPKDLMRSVGKIERDDWNVKEIERKIMENRLGRPEPKTAEKVPKWDREQFLGRQRRLKNGDDSEKWGEIDETLHKLDQKLRDSGRPDHGTKKVANLATKFVKKDEPEQKTQPKEECKKSWRGPSSTGMQCASCGARVFAAEGVVADGLHLHRSCFRCAVCKCVLRPGNYTMERYGSRLVCLRHSGVNVPDAVAAVAALGAVTSLGPTPRALLPPPTPERISLELSDSGAREIDEDEWTDRNFLASETSGAGGLSDDESSSSDEYTDAADSDAEAEVSAGPPPAPRHSSHLYFSDDSFGYDDYSDDGGDSSGNESCSRMRAAREARRLEVPADNRPPTDSSEVESDDESSSVSSSVSSATEVSTDSEFAREETAAPPAILVTEAAAPAPAPAPPAPAAPPPPPPPDYPLSRTRSAGGLATKRALELKRRYLLGEPSPPAVRKSDSTSRLDTKLEAFRSNITEFQKMLHPAPAEPPRPPAIYHFEMKPQPMPDIIRSLCSAAPLDLLASKHHHEDVDGSRPAPEPPKTPPHERGRDVESDSLSESSSTRTETAGRVPPVPRLEVHDEGGELVQLDSLTLPGAADLEVEVEVEETTTGPTVRAAHSDTDTGTESGREATTLALTETELSDWAAETSAALDDCNIDERDDRKRGRNPRSLSGPKTIHDAKNLASISGHVCGRNSPPPPPPPPSHALYSDAIEQFEFADEGEQEPALAEPLLTANHGYMELVDDDYDLYSPNNDRSINFIERSFSETVALPADYVTTPSLTTVTTTDSVITTDSIVNNDSVITTDSIINNDSIITTDSINDSERHDDISRIETSADEELKTPQLLKTIEIETNEQPNSVSVQTSDSVINDVKDRDKVEDVLENLSLSDISPPLERSLNECKPEAPKCIVIPEVRAPLEEISPPLAAETPRSCESFPPPPPPTTSTINTFVTPSRASMRLYSPAICRSASETFDRSHSRSTDSPSRSVELSMSIDLSSGSLSPVSPTPLRATATTDKVQEIKREREEQTEVVRRLVLERLGGAPRVSRKSARRCRPGHVPPVGNVPPPVPPPPTALATPSPPAPPPPPPPPRPAPPLMPLPVTPSFSDPELAHDRRRKSFMKSISNYLNRRLGPRQKWHSEPDLTSHEPSQSRMPVATQAHKSTGALQEAPPVPPPPAGYTPPHDTPSRPQNHRHHVVQGSAPVDVDERDAMQLWFEARWARLVAQRRARDDTTEPHARRVARLERRLTRPLSAEQQAATVAELVQVSAQRQAHQALMAADRRRSGGVCD